MMAHRMFLIAGIFMLINFGALWARYFSAGELSILWAAIPAIIGLSCAVTGLLKLYQRAKVSSPFTAKAGAGCALLACSALGVAALWIFVASVFGEGLPEPPPQGLLAIIALFMLSIVLAFVATAMAFLRSPDQREIGYWLTVPVVMWAIMIMVSMVAGMAVGLGLDYYTNGVIAIAFIGLGLTLEDINPSPTPDSRNSATDG